MLLPPKVGMLSVVATNTTLQMLKICWSTTPYTHTSTVKAATRLLRQTASLRPRYHSAASNLAKEALLQLSGMRQLSYLAATPAEPQGARSRSIDPIFISPDNRRNTCRKVCRSIEPMLRCKICPIWETFRSSRAIVALGSGEFSVQRFFFSSGRTKHCVETRVFDVVVRCEALSGAQSL